MTDDQTPAEQLVKKLVNIAEGRKPNNTSTDRSNPRDALGTFLGQHVDQPKPEPEHEPEQPAAFAMKPDYSQGAQQANHQPDPMATLARLVNRPRYGDDGWRDLSEFDPNR